MNAPRADRGDLAEMKLEALFKFVVEGVVGQRHERSASPVVSVHTIDERRPLSGRIANGPAGRKCSSARPLMVAFVADIDHDGGLAVIPAMHRDAGALADGRACTVGGDQEPRAQHSRRRSAWRSPARCHR